MKNRNVKVVDEHNIDRNANVMFALDLEGSEYVVYWIERDETSNNVFVSKVLKNIDGTYNMVNIDDEDKKKEVAEIVKVLISTSVSDQNDKMVGTTVTLSNGKVAKFLDVSFNKEQNINVSKTYITTVKKEVTKVAENYYDVVVEETKVAEVLPSVTPVVESVSEVFPTVETPVVPVVEPTVAAPTPVTPVVSAPEVVQTVTPEVVVPSAPQPAPTVVEPITVAQPTVAPAPVVVTSTSVAEPVAPVAPAPVIPTPVVATPEVAPIPVVETNQPLVFNATKETNLNAALGEVASSATIPVENIEPVREFGVEEPVVQAVPQQPVLATPTSVVQSEVAIASNVTPVQAGFANSKFFMVVAVAFFLASCIFLGYEVYNYFQLVK